MEPTLPSQEPVRPHLTGPFATAAAVLVAALMISGSILYVGRGSASLGAGVGIGVQDPSQAAPKTVDAKTITDDDPSIGSPNAKVTIVEFSDFQCPFCRRFFTQTWGQLKKEYIDTGKVRVVFRDFPLSFHPGARPAALAAACANEQGKFWQFHDALFAEQQKQGDGTVAFTNDDLKAWARGIGVNATQFNKCLDSQKYAAEVDKDAADGSAAGVEGTPSFFVGTQLVVGAQPFSAFKAAIEKELKN